MIKNPEEQHLMPLSLIITSITIITITTIITSITSIIFITIINSITIIVSITSITIITIITSITSITRSATVCDGEQQNLATAFLDGSQIYGGVRRSQSSCKIS